MLFGNQWKSREQLQCRGCFTNEFASDKCLRFRIVQYLANILSDWMLNTVRELLRITSNTFFCELIISIIYIIGLQPISNKY